MDGVKVDAEAFVEFCASPKTVLVRLQAANTSNAHRYVEVEVYLDGRIVAAGSASDNTAEGVWSCSRQTVTVPVPSGKRITVKQTYGHPSCVAVESF
jgi:hypothetical protein